MGLVCNDFCVYGYFEDGICVCDFCFIGSGC